MKSFRLHIGPKSELVQDVVGISVGAGLFLILHFFPIAETAWRIIAIIAGAVFVGYVCRGRLSRSLRTRYPNARWIGLLAVGLAIAMFGVIARFVVSKADENATTLAFILTAGACIATFVVVNRQDPDVAR
jgi:hypothetical protein